MSLAPFLSRMQFVGMFSSKTHSKQSKTVRVVFECNMGSSAQHRSNRGLAGADAMQPQWTKVECLGLAVPLEGPR